MLLTDVVFRDDLYPRMAGNVGMVQAYAEDLDVLPPIEVNQNGELIDGWHRWTAHKKKEAKTIEAIVTETDDDNHLMELSIRRNAVGLMQLSTQDKKVLARKYYHTTPVEERGAKKAWLADLLKMSERTIQTWLARIDKDSKEEREIAVQNLYLQAFTQEESAEKIYGEITDATKKRIGRVWDEIEDFLICPIPSLFLDDMPDDGATDKVKDAWETARKEKIAQCNEDNAEHAIDFSVPIYNVWKQQTKTEGSEHFGNSESRWVDNLLYLYTQPFDLVVDPFAGGGSTLDVCKTRFRRCWISDRIPIEERSKEIRELDVVVEGLPNLRKRWADVKLVYLDPPYWKQAEGKYSDDPEDLANMDLDTFTDTLSKLIKGFASKLTDAYIALIISPTQWKAPDRQFTDHIADMLRAIKLPIDMRFSAPYESQQYNGTMVDWAKENKKCLVLSREIIVWRID